MSTTMTYEDLAAQLEVAEDDVEMAEEAVFVAEEELDRLRSYPENDMWDTEHAEGAYENAQGILRECEKRYKALAKQWGEANEKREHESLATLNPPATTELDRNVAEARENNVPYPVSMSARKLEVQRVEERIESDTAKVKILKALIERDERTGRAVARYEGFEESVDGWEVMGNRKGNFEVAGKFHHEGGSINEIEKTTVVSGAARYGYTKDGEKDAVEQAIIQRVVQLRYEEHLSHSAIAQVLNDEGYTNRRWNEFTPDNVGHLINCVIPRITGTPKKKRRSGQNPSYGYMWSGDNEIVENPYEQWVMQRAIVLRREKLSYQKIAEQLAMERLLNRAGQPVNKGNVSHWFVSCIPYLNGTEEQIE